MPKLSRLKQASYSEVKEWIEDTIELTPYQRARFDSEQVWRSPFFFYKNKESVPISPLWRITLLVYPIYWCALVAFLPVIFLISGKWGYGRKFIDKFHNVWITKIGL